MIIAPEILYGIDRPINEIQKVLEKIMLFNGKGIRGDKWTECNIYGRINRNLRNDIYIPEIYIGNGEFKEVFVDDGKTAELGFYVKGEIINNNTHTADIDIILSTDFRKLGKMLNTEYLKSKLTNWLYDTRMIEIGSVNEGVEKVFADFDKDRYKYRDMFPFGIISVETTLIYSNTICG